ncbi:MAG: sugar phosphate isomerase/epimerase [Acidobacteriaceae bacterium]|nr:sugar phosphate isomerase/epimerase [Acidobacteriaceae bacterium]MBV9779792.1 sugar phosphate isomerase/epimerase [Acidobacteriaceae bacterium]
MFASSRRRFLAQTAALLPAAHVLAATEKLGPNNLGVQLYTVRNIITKNPAATLKAIQDIGYTEVEATSDNLDQIWSALRQTKLTPVSVHIQTAKFMEGGSQLEKIMDDMKQRGFEYVVLPYVDPKNRGGADVFKRLASTLNQAGQQANARGLTLCYHNHAFEFQPLNGTTGLDILMSETQKDLVHLEIDIFWVTVAGHDPIALLKQYSGRVRLLHLKDKARGGGAQYNENVPKNAFKEVGSGSIDIPGVLSAADASGVRHYFVEQDETPGDPIASLQKSYKYLSTFFEVTPKG